MFLDTGYCDVTNTFPDFHPNPLDENIWGATSFKHDCLETGHQQPTVSLQFKMIILLTILALPHLQARPNQHQSDLATSLLPELNRLKQQFLSPSFHQRKKRSETISSQTVYQFQKKQRKCKNLRSYGIASGSNALSYMSFVASVITLVLNINNNINANNNNNNQVCCWESELPSNYIIRPTLILETTTISCPTSIKMLETTLTWCFLREEKGDIWKILTKKRRRCWRRSWFKLSVICSVNMCIKSRNTVNINFALTLMK